MATIRVAPQPGMLVRNFERGHRPLAAEGEDVTDSIEWRRKINSGEVVVVPAASPAASPSAPPPATPRQRKQPV